MSDECKPKYVDMPNEVALEFIRTLLEPGTPTLGMWFGWNQPDDGDTVKLGSVYAQHTECFSFDDTFNDGAATLDEKKEFIKLCKKHKRNPKHAFNLSGLFVADEVFFPYSELDLEHKMLYRLMVMAINTGGDYHNWACEFGEMLANWYAERNSATCEWTLYEGDDNFTIDFIDTFSHLLPKWDITVDDSGGHDPTYNMKKNVNDDTLEWVEECSEVSSEDFYLWVFGVAKNQYTYWQDDVDTMLAIFIDWMKDDWKEGYLQLTPDSPSELLNDWLRNVGNQPTLFDTLDSKEN